MPKKIDWDFNSLLPEQVKRIGVEDKNSLYYFHIRLEAGYGWGSGWASREAALKYDAQLLDGLEEVFGKTIKSKEDYYEIDTFHCGLYAHPMEWTGFANEENLQKLNKVLDSMSCVKEHSLIEKELLYPFNVNEYQNLIAENYPKIKHWFDVYDLEHQDEPLRVRKTEVGFDFAKQNRLSIRDITDKVTGTLDNHKGYGSLDADISLISNLYRAYEAEKTFIKNKNAQKFQESLDKMKNEQINGTEDRDDFEYGD